MLGKVSCTTHVHKSTKDVQTYDTIKHNVVPQSQFPAGYIVQRHCFILGLYRSVGGYRVWLVV